MAELEELGGEKTGGKSTFIIGIMNIKSINYLTILFNYFTE